MFWTFSEFRQNNASLRLKKLSEHISSELQFFLKGAAKKKVNDSKKERKILPKTLIFVSERVGVYF